MSPVDAALDLLCINTIRTLSIDAIQKANSGHPGMPLGAAPMAYVLWMRHLRHDPANPDWPDRDRFILSGGHGSMLLYSLLHLWGYGLSLEDIQEFRQWDSKTPGHPEKGTTLGVEATTGPLGQGSANAVGMALAERSLAHRFNRPGFNIVDHHTYAIVTDGDLMEGLSAEAASLAGHLKLGKLIYLYDSNDVCLDGPTSMVFTEDVARRYEACGWHVIQVDDGDEDLDAIDKALSAAKQEQSRPSLVIVKTTLGFGSPSVAGSCQAHGAPLGEDEVALTKKELGWQPDRHFHIPDAVQQRFQTARQQGRLLLDEWQQRLEAYADEYPELAGEWDRVLTGALPADWQENLPAFEAGKSVATRAAGGQVLNALAVNVTGLIGGDADLGCSTKTLLSGHGDFEGVEGSGRNIHFGVREHAMAAIANGMSHHGGTRPYVSTFFCFSDYMRPAVRLAAIDRLPVVYVWTHDSIGVGEDGPTHQPVEHLASLRAMPGLTVLRPGDANEALEAWKLAVENRDGPIALVLSRQGLPVLEETGQRASNLRQGAYILAEPANGAPEAIIIGTGSELHLAMEARTLLASEGIAARVVSMPSWELFQARPAAYRNEVLPPRIKARVSVEAAVTFGWERWTGRGGKAIGVDRFGASAPGATVYEKLGVTTARIVEAVKSVLSR